MGEASVPLSLSFTNSSDLFSAVLLHVVPFPTLPYTLGVHEKERCETGFESLRPASLNYFFFGPSPIWSSHPHLPPQWEAVRELIGVTETEVADMRPPEFFLPAGRSLAEKESRKEMRMNQGHVAQL